MGKQTYKVKKNRENTSKISICKFPPYTVTVMLRERVDRKYLPLLLLYELERFRHTDDLPNAVHNLVL